MAHLILKHFTKYCIVFFLMSTFMVKAQSNVTSFGSFKNGTYNYYPQNLKSHFVTRRNRDFQIETNTRTGDTLLLKINWINDYSYTLKYISGSGKTASKMPAFLKKHTFAYQVVNVTKDYYTFRGYRDRISNKAIKTDTMWVKTKTPVPNNVVYKKADPSALQKAGFKDTSTAALLSVY